MKTKSIKTIFKKLLFLLLLLPLSIFAQNTFEGIVLDKATKQPLPGVNLNIKGVSRSNTTDFSGIFKLANLKIGDEITFSFVGYTDQKIVYAGQKNLQVFLVEESNQLKEVVVQVGYGSVKKKDATGSVTTLSAKDFNKGVNISTENMLNGRVAGVTVNTSGAPGSSSEIRIRGGSSLFASNNPLIVIDGLPMDNATNTGSSSFLASLNPATVESITVLKDASATAIYGSRAANGVIIITTKKGSKTLSAEFNSQYSIGNLVKTIDVLNADQFREVIADKRPSDLAQLGTANTDWQRAIYRQTGTLDLSLAVRGNIGGVLPTSLTLGHTDQEGLRLTNGFARQTVGLVMNPSLLNNHLKLKLAANYANEKNRFTDAVEDAALAFNPTQPVYDANSFYGGFFQYINGATNDGQPKLNTNATRNPVARLLQTDDTGTNERYFGNFELDYKLHFFPAIRAVVNVGFDESNGNRTRLSGTNAASSFNIDNIPVGTNEYTTETRKNKLLDAYLVYNKEFKSLKTETTAGYSYQRFDGAKFETGNIFEVSRTLNNETTSYTPRVLLGFFGRSNLNFRDKYLLTLSYRRDGSSTFESDSRWGNFPAAAFAWKIKEDLFKNNKTLSDLKLRLSWGITGQQDIPDPNGYLEKYTVAGGNSQYFFGATPIAVALANKLTKKLKWEETTSYNAGLDFGFFDNRITVSADAFYKLSNDLLVNAATSDGSNFSNRVYQNIGSFSTKGVELLINAAVFKSQKFNWNLSFNATKFERRIEELQGGLDMIVGDNITGLGSFPQIFKEGYTPYSFYVYKQLYNSEGKAIEGAFADLNGDNVINDADRYVYNNPDPDFTAGLASNMNFFNFDFSFNLRASVGNRVFNAVNPTYASYLKLESNGMLFNTPASLLNTNFTTISGPGILSDLYVENASYLRLDNISLGYTLPKLAHNKISVRFSTGMQNVFTLTKYTGLDPEVTGNGVDKTIYPRQRSIVFGANIKF